MRPLEVEFHQTWSPATLKHDWQRLAEESERPNLFLSWEWAAAWWEAYAGGGNDGEDFEPWILAAREEPRGRLVALGPFVIRKARARGIRFRELSFLGANAASPDHLDLLFLPGCRASATRSIADAISAHSKDWDWVRLHGISSASTLLGALADRIAPAQPPVTESVCPFITLPRGWDEYLSSLGGKFRYNLRSRWKRLQRDTQDTARIHSVTSDDDLSRAIEAVFRLHELARERRDGASSFANSAMRHLHERLARAASARGWLRLYLLTVADQPIATAYCFHHLDVVYFYQTGYDPRWAKYGPGAAVIAHAIERSIEEGAREFDFLRGSERYKLEWTQDARTDLSARLPCTARGKLLLGANRWLAGTPDKVIPRRGSG